MVAAITMIIHPDLTPRVIPALAAIQIFGFVAIAVILVTSKRDYTSAPQGTGKQWLPWLFGVLALVNFLRVGLGFLYIAGGHRHFRSWLIPFAEIGLGCFFLWLAVLSGRSSSRTESK